MTQQTADISVFSWVLSNGLPAFLLLSLATCLVVIRQMWTDRKQLEERLDAVQNLRVSDAKEATQALMTVHKEIHQISSSVSRLIDLSLMRESVHKE